MNKLEMANPFYKGLDNPEENKEVKQEESVLIQGLEDLLKKYEDSLDKYYSERYFECLGSIDDILTPEQINTFLQQTIIYEERKNYQNSSGHFISKLIQNSYIAGYNDFVLNTKTLKEIHALGYNLKGEKNKPIEMKIDGNVGGDCGGTAEHSNFEIKGNVEAYCGLNSKHSNFNIEGNTGDRCGSNAQHSNFEIQGNTGDNCGAFAEHSNFDIHGNFDWNIDRIYSSPSDCTFITYKKKLYKRLLKELPEKRKNKAILKDKNDKIIEEKLI